MDGCGSQAAIAVVLAVRRSDFEDGYSVFRGGTLKFISGEARVELFRNDRVSPYVIVGAGRGFSRLNVNADFPEPARNDLRVMFAGAGVRVPVHKHLSLVGDMRMVVAAENVDGGFVDAGIVVPIRIGLAWRF